MIRPLHFTRTLVAEALSPGAVAVDATAGNGYDTEFLAGLVGDGGVVYAFDIQEQAIRSTQARLRNSGLEHRVRLVHDGHERMGEHIAAEHHGRIGVVMFNLGYLPRGDKSITTRSSTSLRAVQAALDILAPDGLVTVMLYPGHPEGAQEAEEIHAWARQLPQERYQVLRYECINLRNSPPWLLAVQNNAVLQER